MNYAGLVVRPEFSTVQEMNEALLERHNSRVKPGDIYYCLGDVMFGDKTEFAKLWPKFNGKKRLVVGNHDDVKFLSSGSFFQKVMSDRQFREHGLMLSHRPLHLTQLETGPPGSKLLLNVHGHIHRAKSPPGPDHNISVEVINYTPVHIEDLAVIARQKEY